MVRLLGSVLHPRNAMRMARSSRTNKRGPATAQKEAEFLESLKRILASNGGSAHTGRINVIGLERLKEQFGDRWDELRDRVHSVTRSALQKCLKPDDIWVASGDKFVIAFGSLGFEEAQTKCRMIAHMIEMALVGDASTETISVATAVTKVDGEVVFRDLPSLEAMIAGRASFTTVRARFPHPGTEPALARPLVAAPHAKPPEARKLAEVEEKILSPGHGRTVWPKRPEAPKTTKVEEKTSSSAQRRIVWPKPPEALEWAKVEVDEETSSPGEGRIVRPKPAEALKMEEIEEEAPSLGERRIVWEPVWDTRLQRITMYRARHADDGTSASGAAHRDEEKMSQLDPGIRDAVIEQLKSCIAQSRLIALGLPIRFWTIASWERRREYIVDLNAAITPELRKLLLIYLSDVPEGVPPKRLTELVATLRPFCRELIVERTVHMLDFAAVASARVFALAADVGDAAMSEASLLQALEHFAHQATKAGVANCYLGGVRTMPLVIGAAAAGFRYIGGSAVGPIRHEVSGARELTVIDLYNNLGYDIGTEAATT